MSMYPQPDPPRTHVHKIADTTALRTTALLVAKVLPHLDWRVHGIGLLQAYLVEADPEIRVHVWYEPSLAKPGIIDSGAIHNHRFALDSTVLYGTIEHTEYGVYPDPEGEYHQWTVPNTRKFQALTKGETPDHQEGQQRVGDLTLVGGLADGGTRTGTRYSALLSHFTIPRGHRYTFMRGPFHHATAGKLAVTIVTKRDQVHDMQANILAPVNRAPEHAFKWKVTPDTIAYVIASAVKALQDTYTVE